METTRLSTKGQVVLPKAIRDAKRWAPGAELAVEETPEGVLLRPLRPFPPTRLDDVAGCLHYSGPARSIEDMEQAIADEVKERHGRGRY